MVHFLGLQDFAFYFNGEFLFFDFSAYGGFQGEGDFIGIAGGGDGAGAGIGQLQVVFCAVFDGEGDHVGVVAFPADGEVFAFLDLFFIAAEFHCFFFCSIIIKNRSNCFRLTKWQGNGGWFL